MEATSVLAANSGLQLRRAERNHAVTERPVFHSIDFQEMQCRISGAQAAMT
jgi:hypothetical protein